MMTVKQAFIKAYGELPAGAVTCHMGYDVAWSGVNTVPTVASEDGLTLYAWSENFQKVGAWDRICDRDTWGPDISDRDALAFEGFFVYPYNLVIALED